MRRSHSPVSSALWLLGGIVGIAGVACGSSGASPPQNMPPSSDDASVFDAASEVDSPSGDARDASADAPVSLCGNGVVDAGEACDGGPCCDTSCHFVVPAGAVEVKPGQDLGAVVAQHGPATTYCVRAGEYRMQSVSPHANDVFAAEHGADMTGARVLTLAKEGSYWVQHGITEQGQTGGMCQMGRDGCIYPEDVFIDDVPLTHVTALAQVAPGAYFLDYAAQTVYLADDPSGKTVEMCSTRAAFEPTADGVSIRGFLIEKFAIPAQMGAIGDQYPSNAWIVEQNEVRYNHGTGINVTNGGVMRNNFVHHNGQKGVGAGGTGVLVQGNEISWNNYAGFDAGWEAGGSKFWSTTNLIVRGNFSHDNAGPGLWTDTNNTGTLYEGNDVERNDGAGIFHEISFDCTIRNNVLKRNALDLTNDWIWGGQIQISTSKNCSVYGNKLVVATEGGVAIALIEQNRGGTYSTHGNDVHDNDITFLGANGANGAAQDLGDETVFTTNSFDHDAYHMPDLTVQHFVWNDHSMPWPGFQSAMQEMHGTVDTNVKP
jgi:hypothetical protein